MKQSMYDIQSELLELVQEIEDKGGEVNSEILKRLEINEEDYEEKLESYLKVIRDYKSSEKRLKEEIDRLKARKSSVSKTIDRLRETVEDTMKQRGIDKHKSDLFTVWFQESVSVDDSEMEEIPEEYKKVKESLDKASIKKALKDGEEFPGISLKTTKSIRIR